MQPVQTCNGSAKPKTEENTYEMVEVRASIGDVYYYVSGGVCLYDYSEEDLRDALEGYGYDSSKNYMDSLIDIYGSAPAAKDIKRGLFYGKQSQILPDYK